jgi:tRNA dimethylallyltransferase
MSLAAQAWFLTGPTAVGKSAVALALAVRINAEIASMDSMAIYRGMDLGTAKPVPEERSQVRHHLLDLASPHEDFSLAQYLDAAHAVASEIWSQRRQVLFVGGTPLYLKGLLRGIFEGPPADWDFRDRLLLRAESRERGWLHDQLRAVDPDTAARLHANDLRRIIRALEVYEVSGRPISGFQKQFEAGMPASACRVFVIDRPRAELYRRIESRVESMFAAGLVDEVRRLLADPRGMSKTARQAVGYAEVIDYCGGKQDFDTTVELVKRHTRQLAKRQATWFRSLSECRFLPIQGDIGPAAVAEQIVQLGSAGERTPTDL